MADKCYRCGAVSEKPGVFVKMHRSFRFGVFTCCPNCRIKAARSELSVRKWLFLGNFLMAGLGLVFLQIPRLETGGWLFLNSFFFEMSMVATIWPHELGHAWAGRALGLRVFKINLGLGKPLFTRKVLGFETEFRPIPLGGLVLLAHREKTGIRCRQFGCVLAGPAVNLLLGAAVVFFQPWEQLWRFEALRQGLAFGQIFFYANLVVLAVNLLPHDVSSPLGKTPSDRKLLWQGMFGKMDPETIHAQWFLLEGVILQQQGNLAEALAWLDRGRSQFPEDLNLLNSRAHCLYEMQRWEEAREAQFVLLAREDLPTSTRSYLRNGVAYTDAILGREELLPEADQCSREAMSGLGWDAGVKGTRGTVLMLMGKMEEGMPLLRESLEQTDYAKGKAENSCWLAMGHARLGEMAEARKYLDEARRLAPDCFLLERGEQALRESSEPKCG